MKHYMFRTVPLSIIRVFLLYTQQWYISYRFADSLRTGLEWNCSSILILLARCRQTCRIYTIAVCTVENSWWWTEELSQTCRVLFQTKKKFESSASSWFYYMKFIKMHGHMNVKVKHPVFLERLMSVGSLYLVSRNIGDSSLSFVLMMLIATIFET
jgi:hypothetical protein